jgi:hypothetical protein
MLAIGIKNRRTYYKALNDLVEWGFIEMLTKSTNQHTASIIALSSACVKNAQASPRHIHKQVPGTAPIDKLLKQEETIKTNINPKEADSNFLIFDFQEEYKNANNITYVLKEEDYSAARQLSEIYKKETGITDEAELRTSLQEYFKAVIRHPDNFHRTRMDLSYLVKNINKINNGLQNVNSNHPATLSELRDIFNRPIKVQESPFLKPVPERLKPPTQEEFFQFFNENGYTKESAENTYWHFNRINWIKEGIDFINDWQFIVEKYYFKPKNKKLMMP